MTKELVKFELQEKDLELVVNEKTLGSLTTNARQIKEMVESALPNYDISNYSEDNIAFAKKDKAMLNAASKALNDRRIQIEKEFMQPFADFKNIVADTIALIKTCSGKIDAVVKQSEENERATKRTLIESAWGEKMFTLVPLAKIFDERWLNKGASLKSIAAELDAKIASINDDISTIEAIGEDTDLLKSIYLDTLNLNSTIQYANKLKVNKERAKAEEAAREEARQAAAKAEEAAFSNPPQLVVFDATLRTAAPPTQQLEPLLIRAFEITATKTQIINLASYLDSQGIAYKKVRLAEETEE